MNNLLTVAIPTYNRAKSLERILRKIKKERGFFQILVSDNNSADNTEELIQKYQKTMPNLIYNKNETNLGYSGNILKLYELSKTRYIWYLSDDEEILSGTIGKVVEAINKYKSTVMIFSHKRIDPYGRELIDGVEEDVCYKNIDEIKNYSIILRTCFLSILVIEKILPLSDIKKVYDKNNVYFQLSLSLLLLKKRFSLCEVASPIVFRRATYRSGEFFKFLFTDWLDASFIVKAGFDKGKFMKFAREEIFSNFQIYLAQKLGMYKYQGVPTIRTIKKIIYYYGLLSPLILSFPLIYALVPSELLKRIYKRKLISLYGKNWLKIYNQNLNRVYKETREAGFIEYR